MDDNMVKFKYVFDKTYNQQYANGAFGGITPHGEVVVNFYFERSGLPYEQTFSLKDDGTIGDLVQTEPEEFKFVRYIQNGIILSRQDARGIAEWLLEVLDEDEGE